MTYMIFGFCNIFINGKCIHFWVTIAFNLNTIPCIHGNGFSLHLHSIWCQYYISLLHDNLSKRSSVKPTENYLWISQDQSWLTTYRRLPLNITGSLTNHDWQPTEDNLWISQGAGPIMTDNLQKMTSEYHREPDQSWLTTYRKWPLNITGSLTNHDWQSTEDNLWISQGAWPIMTDNLQKITSEYHREPHQSWLTIYRKLPLNITGSLTNHDSQSTENFLWISQGVWPIMTHNLQKITSEYHRESDQS